MPSSTMSLKMALVCYAILSLPYVTLALGSAQTQPGSNNDHKNETQEELGLVLVNTTSNHNFSTDVMNNFPQDQQEVFYFRNFSLVGKASEGFNVTQWEIDNNHPSRANRTLVEREDSWGDFALKIAGSGTIIAAAGATIGGLICITRYPGCARYVGHNIGTFWQAIGAAGGAAAVQATSAVAGAAPDALESVAGVASSKRDFILDEEFGCVTLPGHSDICTDPQFAVTAFTQVLTHDGSSSPPSWSCYQAYDDKTGVTWGYFSHCLAQGAGSCSLQCGPGRPEITSNIEPIEYPPSK